jgi:hypothetical protein
MSRIFKWILGILLVLVVFAGLAFAGYMLYTHWTGAGWMPEQRAFQFRDNLPWCDRMPMFGYHMPGMRFGGFFFSFILGGIFRLGTLVLVVIGIVALVRAIWPARPVMVAPASPITAAPTSMPAAGPSEVAPGESTFSTCASCASPLQPGWKHCPNCGAPVGT